MFIEIEQVREPQDLDDLLTDADGTDALPNSAKIDVGGLLSPSDIRNADVLERIAGTTWIFSNGETTELRRVPKSLERVAIFRSRRIAKDQADLEL